jgi:hypothetical protein
MESLQVRKMSNKPNPFGLGMLQQQCETQTNGACVRTHQVRSNALGRDPFLHLVHFAPLWPCFVVRTCTSQNTKNTKIVRY